MPTDLVLTTSARALVRAAEWLRCRAAQSYVPDVVHVQPCRGVSVTRHGLNGQQAGVPRGDMGAPHPCNSATCSPRPTQHHRSHTDPLRPTPPSYPRHDNTHVSSTLFPRPPEHGHVVLHADHLHRPAPVVDGPAQHVERSVHTLWVGAGVRGF